MTDVVHLPPYKVSFTYAPQSADGVDWGVSSYGIPQLWKQTKGEGVTVAVVDSGVAKHTALNDVVVDYRNFTTDGEVYDTLGHGTHVAGIIAARSPVAHGIAPDAKLLSLKVLGHSGMGSNEAVSQAVLHAVEAKADIISMSLGSKHADDRLHSAIRHAHANGIIVVCAAGNDGGRVNYPAAFQETIGVGAVDREGNACEFSSRGKEIVVAAPGQDITSTWLADGYATLTGTSMAAPFVSGVLALYVSAMKRDGHKIDHAKVTSALQQTCKDAGPAGRDDVYGWGLVDPHRLLNYQIQSGVAGVTIFIPGARII
jgi:subtilisin family serine protease